jgi:hypothetical protein
VGLNRCGECGTPHWRLLGTKGECSKTCYLARHRKAARTNYAQNETERRMKADQLPPRRLLRDLDGYVHSPCGFLSQKRYERMRAEHPGHNFPEYAAIPLMSELTEDDLQAWYGLRASAA